VSILDLANTLVELFPEKNLRVAQMVDAQSSTYIESKVRVGSVDTSKARRLGWEPKISISEGFKRTVRSFQ
jgi:UDP-glucuronate decarboxylase